ncbi:sensor histidine kinase [Serinicoccus kebangsaanensis]|uniref:sensor histidine kinase n=1 Tax=Serinicoccus kebangsaanensis TaxID=2602069 RepID=UPI00124DF1E3|nr:HAMP domain-containing sensor histidine kinase [Serinicoccus kebangsaanensis]
MRQILRELAVRIVLIIVGASLLLGIFSAWLVPELQEAPWPGGVGDVPVWAVLVVLVLSSGVVLGAGIPTARSLADRAAETAAGPLRQLAQRTDELASGGFALDPDARPGRLVEPEPFRSGIAEIDAVARVVDRHHNTFARALVFERSFAADASHQLRTPMAALLLRLEEIAQSDDPAVARSEAEIAIGQVGRLTGVVDDLLQRTRAGHASGGAVTAADAVVAGLDEEWTPAFEDRGRRIELSCERGVIVEASASVLSQVLNTLVENSLVHGRGDVAVRVYRSGPSAVFTVSDQGPGIPRDLARTIFDRGITTGDGTGLGLGVARETAESIGGRVELVHAFPPVFACYLPLATTP